MDSDEHSRAVANRIVSALSFHVSGCPIRFGRTHKVTQRFEGRAHGIQWKGPCRRRGGAFVVLCDYGTMKKQEHRMVLKQMLLDYSEFLHYLRCSNAQPLKKRRNPYEPVRNKAVNASNDLELFIKGAWISFGNLFPTKVRQLQSPHVENWLLANPEPSMEEQEQILRTNNEACQIQQERDCTNQFEWKLGDMQDPHHMEYDSCHDFGEHVEDDDVSVDSLNYENIKQDLSGSFDSKVRFLLHRFLFLLHP